MTTTLTPRRPSWRPSNLGPVMFYDMNARDYQARMKAKGGVVALNNFAAAATPDYLQGESLTQFLHCFAPLRAFNSVYDPAPYATKAKNIIKYVDAGSATLVDATNFQQGGSDIGAVECLVNHYSQPWPVSTKDLQSGIRERDLFLANAQELADTLTEKWASLLTAANFPNIPVITASFGISDAATAYGALKGVKSLILDSPQFGLMSHLSTKAFQSGDAAHGWQGIHECSSGWSAADPKVHGVALAKPAIVLVTGFLAEIPFSNVQRTQIGIPGLDLVVDHFRWFDQPTRTIWNSLDCIFGPAKADPTAAVLIKTP